MVTSRNALVLSIVVLSASLLAGCPDNKGQSPAAPSTSAAPVAPQAPLVPKAQIADWCGEHGVPESICTRCNTALVAEFQKKGDWCKGHGLPESQCVPCHPELKAKFEAMAPKKAGQ